MNHIDPIVTKYVHHQLTAKQRRAVNDHIRTCEHCRVLLDRELKLSQELAARMPLMGRPADARLNRLLPAILAEVRARQAEPQFIPQLILSPLSQYGVALVLLTVMCAFIASTIFHSPVSAMEVPFQLQPSDIQATWTPVVTDPPHGNGTIQEPTASLTSVALMMQGLASPTLPIGASPAPIAK